MTGPDLQIHGTAVSIGGSAVLIRGEAGSGKSDLALRLINAGAVLVADDRTDLEKRAGELRVSPPATIAGLLEVRGVGIVELAYETGIPLRLVIDLAPADQIERLPVPAATEVLGVAVPLVKLTPFETSTPDKVRMALKLALGEIGSRS